MKRKLSRILSLTFILAILTGSSILSTNAVSYSNPVKTVSDSIILINMDSGQTVFEKDADTKRYPASTTKIMTYAIVAENVDDFENTKVEIKQSVLDLLDGTGSSLANLSYHVGKKMSVLDLLYSMMVPSGNDAAMVLADYVGKGSIQSFVDMMNAKAKELGCENTHFDNPDGLHSKNHYTTARDLSKITTYALTLPKFAEITNTDTYYCEGDDIPLVTTNYMIDKYRGGDYYYMYAKGIKTGTTNEAGRCLVTTATADGYSYLAVLLHAPYEEGKHEEYGTMTDAADLFRWSLTSLEMRNIATSHTPVCEEKVNLSWGKKSVLLIPQTDLNAIVPRDAKEENIVIESSLPDSIDAPVDTSQVVGTATISYKDSETGELQEITKVNLVPGEKIERSGVLYVLRVMGTMFRSYWFLMIAAIIVLILIIYFIAAKIHRKRSRKNRSVKKYRNL